MTEQPAPVTPGQAAREAFIAARDATTGDGYNPADWDKLHLQWWEAAAQAAIAAAPPVIIKFDGKLNEADAAELREKFREAVRNERPRVIP